jgi:HSP20 family molecular chaperone IbpA
MKNMLTVFDRMPSIFPTAFESNFLSANLFDEVDKIFNCQKLRQMSVYPTDIYTLMQDDEAIATVIEIACAGISRDRCEVKLDENKLFVNIGFILETGHEPVSEPVKEEKQSKKSKAKETKTEPVVECTEAKIERKYIQKQIAERTASMSWTLSNKIDKKNIDVKYVDGVLKITCPYRKKDADETKIFDIQ